MGKLTFLRNVICAFIVYHLFWMSPPPIGAWNEIEPFNPHLTYHTITTLIFHAQQKEHIRCAWNPLDALTFYLGKKISNYFFHPWC
jgi:hypothetical protein